MHSEDDMTRKYNTIANAALILASVYAVITIPAAIIGYYLLYHGMDIISFAEKYAGNAVLGIFVIVFRFFLNFANSGIWLIWIWYIVKDKVSIRFPVIASFSYYAAELLYEAINNIINHESLLVLIKERYLTFFIMVAWLVLIIKTDEMHRKVFTVIRLLALMLSFIFNCIFYVRLIINRIEFETPLYAHDYIGIADACFRYLIIAMLIIWIFNSKVYLRKSHEEDI